MRASKLYTHNNFEIELKDFRLEPGFYVVAGQQGAGKTSFVTALLSLDYKYHAEERIRIAQARVNQLNHLGYKLMLPEHIYFSNIELSLTKPLANSGAVKTYCVTVDRFGLPNDDYPVQYFPIGSVVYISEADVWLYTSQWQKVSKYIWNLIKYCRHNMMTIIFDVQVFDRLPIQLRKLCTDLIYITESFYRPKRFFGLIKQRTHWSYNWSHPQLFAAMSELAKIGANVPVKEMSFNGGMTYKGSIYQQYDSYSGEMYFLNGIENVGYTIQSHPSKNFSPEGIKAYCDTLPLASMTNEKD